MSERHHLDDEVLSAILDGEEPPSAHLDGCESCRARSQELARASRFLGGTVAPPDAARREVAITAALDAWPPTRTRWRPSGPLLAAAALILVIGALVPILASRHTSRNDSSAASDTRAAAPAPKTASGAGSTSAAMAAPATVQAGDLGAIDGDLRARVVSALAEGSRESAPPDGPFACDSEVRAMDEHAASLVLFGRGTVNDRAGYVLVYTVDGSAAPRLAAYVVAVDSCATILQFASFSAPSGGEAPTGTR